MKTSLHSQSNTALSQETATDQMARLSTEIDQIKPPEFKVVFVGAINVGKSSLVARFVKNEYQEYLAPTTGAAFSRATVNLPQGAVKLQLWDTAGQEKYKALVRIYYRGAAAAIVTFDVSNKESFEYAKTWVQDLRMEDSSMVVVLAANKSDLEDPRAFMKEAHEYATQQSLPIFETSAKTGNNVKELFDDLADKVVRRDNQLRNAIDTEPGRRDTVSTEAMDSDFDPSPQPDYPRPRKAGCAC